MMRSSRWSNPGFVVAAVLAAALVIVIAVFSLRRFNFCSPREVQWLKDTPIAHRGLHDDTRDENSLSAFAHAVYRGYAIELDVRLTKDEVPVVFHDDNLSRLCGVDKSVSEMELDIPAMRSEACARLVREAVGTLGVGPDGTIKEVRTDVDLRKAWVQFDNVRLGRRNVEVAVRHAGFAVNDLPADKDAQARLPAECRGDE